jgi:hypothetical protein
MRPAHEPEGGEFHCPEWEFWMPVGTASGGSMLKLLWSEIEQRIIAADIGVYGRLDA